MTSTHLRLILLRHPTSPFTSSSLFRGAASNGFRSCVATRQLATVSSKKPKIIDLSRELYHRALAHPFHPPVIITPWDTHQPKKAGDTVLRSASYSISFSDHAGTHVDAPKHFDPSPGALSVDQMPLETFYTEGIALDLSHVELKASISVPEMEEALEKSGEVIKEGDTGSSQHLIDILLVLNFSKVLLYMAFNKRIHHDDPRWQVSKLTTHHHEGLPLSGLT